MILLQFTLFSQRLAWNYDFEIRLGNLMELCMSLRAAGDLDQMAVKEASELEGTNDSMVTESYQVRPDKFGREIHSFVLYCFKVQIFLR